MEAPVLLSSPATDLGIGVVPGEIQGSKEVESAPAQIRSLFTEFEVVEKVAFVPHPGGDH